MQNFVKRMQIFIKNTSMFKKISKDNHTRIISKDKTLKNIFIINFQKKERKIENTLNI